MSDHLRSVRFCRYADDGVIHCKSQAQAEFVLRRVGERFRECGLELHPEKTRIVYCQDINRPAAYPTVQFTFLGYTFRPRKAVDKYGRVYVNFAPAVSREALRAMRQTIRGWHLQLICDKQIDDLSRMFNPVLRGWRNYYGRFHGSAMAAVWKHLNEYLCAGCSASTSPSLAIKRGRGRRWGDWPTPIPRLLCIGNWVSCNGSMMGAG